MTPSQPAPSLSDDVLDAVPSLRAFAISLCGQVDRADDLVQDTLLRALSLSIASRPAPTITPGCSRFCATSSTRSTASVGGRSRIRTAPSRAG